LENFALAANDAEFATLPQTESGTSTDCLSPAANDGGFANPEGEKEDISLANVGADNLSYTQSVARRIKEERQKAKDELVNEIYGHLGLASYAAYREAVGKDGSLARAEEPDFSHAGEVNENGLNAQEQVVLEQYRQEAQYHQDAILADLALRSDKDWGSIYTPMADEVKAMAVKNGCDLEAAFLVLLGERIGDILRQSQYAAEQKALEKIAAQRMQSPGSVANDNVPLANPYGNLSNEEFAGLVERVKQKPKV